MAKNTDTTSSSIIGTDTSLKQKGDSETLEILNDYIKTQEKVISNLKIKVTRDITKLKAEEIEPLKKNLADELKELKNRSDRTIETIGIFAALLSFVTFEAQIFKSGLNSFTLIGLSSLLLGALLIFVFALNTAFNKLTNSSWKESFKNPLLYFAIALVIIGIVCASIGYKQDNQEQESFKELQNEVNQIKLEHTASSTEVSAKINNLEEKNSELFSEDGATQLDLFKECIKNKGLARCL